MLIRIILTNTLKHLLIIKINNKFCFELCGVRAAADTCGLRT